MSEDRLDKTVLGKDRLGTGSAPTEFGVFDAGLLAGGEHWSRVVMEFAILGHESWDCSAVVDGNRLAKKLESPGSHVPIELRMMRRIKDETRSHFAILPARSPGRGILTGRSERPAFNRRVPSQIFEWT